MIVADYFDYLEYLSLEGLRKEMVQMRDAGQHDSRVVARILKLIAGKKALMPEFNQCKHRLEFNSHRYESDRYIAASGDNSTIDNV